METRRIIKRLKMIESAGNTYVELLSFLAKIPIASNAEDVIPSSAFIGTRRAICISEVTARRLCELLPTVTKLWRNNQHNILFSFGHYRLKRDDSLKYMEFGIDYNLVSREHYATDQGGFGFPGFIPPTPTKPVSVSQVESLM